LEINIFFLSFQWSTIFGGLPLSGVFKVFLERFQSAQNGVFNAFQCASFGNSVQASACKSSATALP
jgi:hypothetical protein